MLLFIALKDCSLKGYMMENKKRYSTRLDLSFN